MLLMPPHALKRVDTQLLAGAELVAVIGVLVHVVPDSIALVEVVVCQHKRSHSEARTGTGRGASETIAAYRSP